MKVATPADVESVKIWKSRSPLAQMSSTAKAGPPKSGTIWKRSSHMCYNKIKLWKTLYMKVSGRYILISSLSLSKIIEVSKLPNQRAALQPIIEYCNKESQSWIPFSGGYLVTFCILNRSVVCSSFKSNTLKGTPIFAVRKLAACSKSGDVGAGNTSIPTAVLFVYPLSFDQCVHLTAQSNFQAIIVGCDTFLYIRS